MNPALLATLGTLAETASLKADILPPVSGENAPRVYPAENGGRGGGGARS